MGGRDTERPNALLVMIMRAKEDVIERTEGEIEGERLVSSAHINDFIF